MKENFDATQFITFDIKNNLEWIMEQIQNRFSNLGFHIINEKGIRRVKMQYFNEYRKTIFIELVDETFIGEIEYWKVDSEMPVKRIIDFSNQLFWLYSREEVSNLNLILTGFAEKEFTTNTKIEVNSDEILKGMSTMSKYYFDMWTDNLIIKIM